MALPALGALLLLAAAGCQRDDVRHYRVPKEGGAPGASALPAGMPAGMPAMDPSAVPPPPAVEGGLSWTLPKGWTESRAGGMRYATLVPSTPGKLDVSVVVLPGPAGGELANVNRWRGQIGLAPLDDAALAAARKTVSTKAGPIKVYDFSSGGASGKRLVAGLTELEGNTWFVKLTGEAAAVGAARDDFMKLLGSLRLDESR